MACKLNKMIESQLMFPDIKCCRYIHFPISRNKITKPEIKLFMIIIIVINIYMFFKL